MPAIRATASTSPLGTVPVRNASTTSAEQRTEATAVADRPVVPAALAMAGTALLAAVVTALVRARRG